MPSSPRRRHAAPLLALGCATLLAAACSDAGPERLVLIVVDTLRRDALSGYGGSEPTPHIDALAARGARFTQLWASFHQTSMSMGALFTGRVPSLSSGDPEAPLAWTGSNWCGMARFAAKGTPPGVCLPPALRTLPERLREAGYWTIGILSNDFLHAPSGFERGFDDAVEVGLPPDAERRKQPTSLRLRSGEAVNRAALRALRRRPNDRFFLYVHYMDAHDYHLRGVPYAEGVREADAAVGALLSRLEREALLEEAVVILTSDHGELLGERHPPIRRPRFNHFGNPSHAELLRLPLLVAPAPARDPDAFLRTQDLHDLVLAIAGRPSGGASEALEPDELWLSELDYRTHLAGRFKLHVRRADGAATLFDLERDPGETRDVAALHPEIVEERLRRMDTLTRRLAAGSEGSQPLSPGDRRRLEALGYLESEPTSARPTR